PHPRRAGSLASPAAQAAIEMAPQRRVIKGDYPIRRRLHLKESPTRAVPFVAQEIIGRASGQAEPAMNAGAQQIAGKRGPGQRRRCHLQSFHEAAWIQGGGGIQSGLEPTDQTWGCDRPPYIQSNFGLGGAVLDDQVSASTAGPGTELGYQKWNLRRRDLGQRVYYPTAGVRDHGGARERGR